MDRDTLTLNLHRAGNQWAVCCAMGDYAEAERLATEIEGYTRALDRLDMEASIQRGLEQAATGQTQRRPDLLRDPWDALKGSPEHG